MLAKAFEDEEAGFEIWKVSKPQVNVLCADLRSAFFKSLELFQKSGGAYISWALVVDALGRHQVL